MARNPSMNSLKTPDMKNLTENQKKAIAAEEKFSRIGHTGANTGVEFARASKHQDIELKSNKPELPPDGVKINEQFTSSKRGSKPASKKRVKGAGYTYVGRARLIRAAVIILLLAAFIVLFAPPLCRSNSSVSASRSDTLFGSAKNLTQYKSDLMDKYDVYNINALSSKDSSEYRICTVAFDVTNYGPLDLTMSDCAVMFGGELKDRIVYACSASGAQEIGAFTTKTIEVEILVCTEGLTNEELNSAVTSLTITTKGLKKRISGFELPCIPGFMGVSNDLSFKL